MDHAPTPRERRLIPAGHALMIGLIGLLIGTLLNAQGLLETAERQELGPVRTMAVGVMRPVAAISSALRLDVPRSTIERALGNEPQQEPLEVASPPVVLTPTEPTTTVPEPGPPRAVTEEDPLRVWVVADSFGELFGPAMVNRGADTGLVDVEVDFRFETGLSRPDFFDWPAHVAARLPDVAPDAVVAIFGGNDGQDVLYEGEVLEVGTAQWQEVYALRVGAMMDALAEGSDQVYWIGMPIMKSDSFSDKVQMMNRIYEAEAGDRSDVAYVDIWDLFQDSNGQYATFLPDETGELVKMRSADNAHFYWGGAYRLADHVLPMISDRWDFDLPAEPS